MFDIYAFRYFKLQLFLLSSLLFSEGSFADETCLDMHVIQSVPLGFYDENNKVAGMDFDILQQIEEYSGICMTMRLIPIARIWKSFEQGQHDGGLIFKTAESNHSVEYAAFVGNAEIIIIPRNGLTIDSYEQLPKMSIAKTRGTPISDRFDLDIRLNLVEVTTYGQLIKMLKLGRIDAVVGNAAPLFYNLSRFDNTEKSIVVGNKFVLGSRETWLQFSKKSTNLTQLPKLKKAVELMHDNGDYQRIMSKYYGHVVGGVTAIR
jgi:polar amino acid transport system substrate-binding protein